MQAITQLKQSEYEDLRSQNEVMLPYDVEENAIIHELPFGTWFEYSGMVYMKVDSFYYDCVSLGGHVRMLDYGTGARCRVLSNVEAALALGYR